LLIYSIIPEKRKKGDIGPWGMKTRERGVLRKGTALDQ